MIDAELAHLPIEMWPTKLGEADSTIPFEITQIKEKFGTLRFYYHIVYDGTGITEAQANRIGAAINLTEELSSTVCEVCGEIGGPCVKQGWMKTLCPECMAMMEYEELPQEDDTALDKYSSTAGEESQNEEQPF